MPPARQKHDWLGLLLASAGSIFATVAVMQSNVLTFESQQQQSIVSNQEALYERIALLEKRIETLSQQRISDRVQIVMLEAQLRTKPDPLQSLYTYVEKLESAAWLKMYYPSEDKFRMLYINSDYEDQYNVSRERYIDSTDFDIHPATLAQQYEKNDRQVLQSKDFRRFVEAAPDPKNRQRMIPMRFWKFYVQLPDGRELIAGIEVGPA